MEEFYDFYAKENHYKMKFGEWHITKAFEPPARSEEAQHVAKGDYLCPVDLQKVKRHTARRRLSGISSYELEISSSPVDSYSSAATPEPPSFEMGVSDADDSATLTTTTISTPSTTSLAPLQRPLVLSPEARNHEMALFNVNAYYHARLDDLESHTTSQDILQFCSMPKCDLFWSNVKNGIYLRKIASTFPDTGLSSYAFRAAYSLIHEAISEMSFDFVLELVATLSPINTRACPNIRLELLIHLGRQAQCRFGITHPLTALCRVLLQDTDRTEMCRRSLICISNIFSNRLGPSHPLTFKTLNWLSTLMRRNNELGIAKQFAEDALILARNDHGTGSLVARAAAFNLSRTLTKLGDYGRALTLCREAVDDPCEISHELQSIEADSNPASKHVCTGFHTDVIAVHAMADIAEYYVRVGHVEEAIIWLHRGEMVARGLWGDSVATQHISDKLDNLLQGNLEGQVVDGRMLDDEAHPVASQQEADTEVESP